MSDGSPSLRGAQRRGNPSLRPTYRFLIAMLLREYYSRGNPKRQFIVAREIQICEQNNFPYIY
jgi:hypothetical protein